MHIISRTHNETIAIITCRAWTRNPARPETVRIQDGEVTVYDSIARHYTKNHVLGAADLSRIIRLAAISR